ncbi:cysteine repeat modular protein 3, putative [Plasmodium chabaudi chabaudi]|uniref:Cysteine repeat modular protein 3, putative n=1 Tax=Plasmodium chabaudi chabaudi TaxID=31271 RepID=A0A4V0K445_PLACU|nr:cysteine repeat modular protein 3, putative [Plasmodium chabaudi chabaudi]VTZ67681.1 cysteine repeat modular protein 3, putative [Plasmodium chabaudi chabaudi]|eukprot:XP_016653418.1 cysteine repeat modular protein 3, putative [Plasmodium chabaudi chabaudi]
MEIKAIILFISFFAYNANIIIKNELVKIKQYYNYEYNINRSNNYLLPHSYEIYAFPIDKTTPSYSTFVLNNNKSVVRNYYKFEKCSNCLRYCQIKIFHRNKIKNYSRQSKQNKNIFIDIILSNVLNKKRVHSNNYLYYLIINDCKYVKQKHGVWSTENMISNQNRIIQVKKKTKYISNKIYHMLLFFIDLYKFIQNKTIDCIFSKNTNKESFFKGMNDLKNNKWLFIRVTHLPLVYYDYFNKNYDHITSKKRKKRYLEEIINMGNIFNQMNKKINIATKSHESNRPINRKGDAHKNNKNGNNMHYQNNIKKIKHSKKNSTKLLKSRFLDKNIYYSNLSKIKNNVLSTIHLNYSLSNNIKDSINIQFMPNQTFIRSKNALISLKIYGNINDNTSNGYIYIYELYGKCGGRPITIVRIINVTDRYIITDKFEMPDIGTFSICFHIKTTYIPIGKLRIQNNLIEQFDIIAEENYISTFNCQLNESTILLQMNSYIGTVYVNFNGKLTYNYNMRSKIENIAKSKIHSIACSSSGNYIAILQKTYVFIFQKDFKLFVEVIFHFLGNPISIFLDGNFIYISDASRKNIFRYVSIYITNKGMEGHISLLDTGFNSAQRNKMRNGNLQNPMHDESDKNIKKKLTKLEIPNLLQRNITRQNIEKHEHRNGINFIIGNARYANGSTIPSQDNMNLHALINDRISLVYPAGIVVLDNRLYFVDTILHVLFCYCLKKNEMIEMYGYLNSPIKSDSGLDQPYSLSLHYYDEAKINLLFLSELSTSRILIFEIDNSIKLYQVYNDLPFNIITDVIATPRFLVVCGMNLNNENITSYITFIEIKDLSDIKIKYNGFPRSFKHNEIVYIPPLIKSDNITKFIMNQYDHNTPPNNIVTGLEIEKHTGIIYGKIEISAVFNIEITVYSNLTKKILILKNNVSTCPIGHFYNNNANNCELCPIGSFSTYIMQDECYRCEDYLKNSTTFYRGSDSENECLCKPGYYLRENKCVKCQEGFYKDVIGNFKCHLTCEFMRTSTVTGAKSYKELNCSCKDGYYTTYDSTCLPCPFHNYCLYNPENSNYGTDIIPCGANSLTLTKGASSPSQCACSRGYYYNINTNNCHPCNFDKYKAFISNEPCEYFVHNPVYSQEYLPNENYIQGHNIYLKQTNNSMFAMRKGSKTLQKATLCESGYFYSMNKSFCSICRYDHICKGLYNPIAQCPIYSITTKLKSDSYLDCLCIRGYGRIIVNDFNNFSISCKPCPYDTFQPHHSAGECIPCPPYTFTKKTKSTSITNCIPKNGYYSQYFKYIYEYTKTILIQNIPNFLQQYHIYINNQYTEIKRNVAEKGKNENHIKENNDGKRYCYKNDIPFDLSVNKYGYNGKKESSGYFKTYAKKYNKINAKDKMICSKSYNNDDDNYSEESNFSPTQKTSKKLNIHKINNNIRHLKSPYNNIFHTNYLKNIILMDRVKHYNFFQQNPNFFKINNTKRNRKGGVGDTIEVINNHKNGISLINVTKISSSITEIEKTINEINILSTTYKDILKNITKREYTYNSSKYQNIIYSCYQTEQLTKHTKNTIYTITIHETDIINCLNKCISNVYCTGIELDQRDNKGKTHISYVLSKSSGPENVNIYKCDLFLYEEPDPDYDEDDKNIKGGKFYNKISDIHKYNPTNKITRCIIQKNPIFQLWKIFTFEKCPNNYYCLGNSYEKSKCPLNSVKKEFQGKAKNCLCLPGFYFNVNTKKCIECPKGTYKYNISNENCLECPLNLTTVSEMSTSIYDCVCKEGYYFEGTNQIKLINTNKLKRNLLKSYEPNKHTRLQQIKNIFLEVNQTNNFFKNPKIIKSKFTEQEKVKYATKRRKSKYGIKNNLISINDINFIQTENIQVINLNPIYQNTKNSEKYLHSTADSKDAQKHTYHNINEKCVKCPDGMFCPGAWLKSFEFQIHHPPIFCPEGSFIPKTTIISTDINKCLCKKGYSINFNSNKNKCIKCKERYYKDVVDDSLCAGLCMEYSTSFKGSISKNQCFCNTGKYMIRESSNEIKCISCPQGSLCIGGLKYKPLTILIKNINYTNIEMIDHTVPFPQKGYFATFEIMHPNFSWTPLNSVNLQINNYDNSDIVLSDKLLFDVFYTKRNYVELEVNNFRNDNKTSLFVKNRTFFRKKIILDIYDNKNNKGIHFLKQGNKTPVLITENGEKIKYKNHLLTLDRIPDFHICPIMKKCAGGIHNLCYEGSEGYLCSSCSKNYDTNYFRSQCFKCQEIKIEILNFILFKIVFYALIFFLIYLNYFCYIKKNFVFIAIFKIWYAFIISFIPYIFIMDSSLPREENYILYFQFFTSLPIRFITQYLKINCFINSYNNEKYIYVWYVQRFIKIAEPIIDCFFLICIFICFYLVYTLWNRQKICRIQKVIKKQINKEYNNKEYYQYVSDFYYHYYQKGVIDTINNKRKKTYLEYMKYDRDPFSSYNSLSFRAPLLKKWKNKKSSHKWDKRKPHSVTSWKSNIIQSSKWINQKVSNKIPKWINKKNEIKQKTKTTSLGDVNFWESSSFSHNKELKKENSNEYDFPDVINFKKDIYSKIKKTNSLSIEENKTKDNYWTYICLLNMYNIKAMGIFRYIHPPNISIRKKIRSMLSDLNAIYIIVFYIHFPFTLMSMLELVWCQPTKYKDKLPILILYHMPSQICNFQNKLFLSGVLFSVFFFFIYLFLFIKYFYDTFKNFKVFQSYERHFKCYFLFNGYNYQNRCWDFVNIIKIVLFVTSFMCQFYTNGIDNSKYFIFSCIIFIIITEIALILLYSPYDKRSNNVLQKLNLLSIFSVLITYLTTQISFFFDFYIISILPFILFIYFHIHTINKIVLEFALYKNVLMKPTRQKQKIDSEGLLNENNIFFDSYLNTETNIQDNYDDIICSKSNKINRNDKRNQKEIYSKIKENYNLLNFVLRINKIPSCSIFFNEKNEEIFVQDSNDIIKSGYEKKETYLKKCNNSHKIIPNRTTLDILYSDLLNYNKKDQNNEIFINLNNSGAKKYCYSSGGSKMSKDESLSNRNGSQQFSNTEQIVESSEAYKEKNVLDNHNSSLNKIHFTKYLTDAINVLFVNQCYNQISVEWLSFVIRFSICFIHWMKNHDKNIIDFPPLNKRQFELKKRNLLFYSLFSSYSELYSLYLNINKYNKFTTNKNDFVKAENLEMFYKYLTRVNQLNIQTNEENVQRDNDKMSKPFVPSNFLDDEFYTCEHDIIAMLFDKSIFKNLSITLVELQYAIYMIQFIESKRLSILFFLFCEKKKKKIIKEKSYINMIKDTKRHIQNILTNDNNINQVYEIEHCYLKENNNIIKDKIKGLQKLINKKKNNKYPKIDSIKGIISDENDKNIDNE